MRNNVAYFDNMFQSFVYFNRDSDKMRVERLQKEFEDARASQTQGGFKFCHSQFFFKALLQLACYV